MILSQVTGSRARRIFPSVVGVGQVLLVVYSIFFSPVKFFFWFLVTIVAQLWQILMKKSLRLLCCCRWQSAWKNMSIVIFAIVACQHITQLSHD